MNEPGPIGQCDVCRILDGDTSGKAVKFCPLCSAWMCDSCRANPIRRAQAAAMRLFGWSRG